MQRTLLALSTTVTLAGCSTTGPEGTGRLTFMIAATSNSSIQASAPAEDLLTITSVQVVARKIRLARAEGTCNEEPEANEDPETGTPDCSVLWLEPRLLEPQIDETAQSIFSVDLPEGSYDRLKLQVHKPTNSTNDAAFLAEHPDFQGVSIRVLGTFNGTDFTFTTSLTSVIDVALEAPVEVGPDAPIAVTLALDLAGWFTSDGALLDPTSPTQQIRAQIEQNIRGSFRAF